MNGIDNIINAILNDAKEDAAATKEQTEAQIKEIKNKADAEVAKEIELIEKELAKKSEELKTREKTILGVEIRRNNLMVKREMVNLSFDNAINSLCNLPDSEYNDIILKLLVQSSETGDEEVVAGKDNKVNQSMIDLANKKLKEAMRKGELKLASDKGKFVGGFVLRKKGIETNCTFNMLINQAKPQIESDVSKLLFS